MFLFFCSSVSFVSKKSLMDSHSSIVFGCMIHKEIKMMMISQLSIIFFRNKPWFCEYVFRIVSAWDSVYNVDDALLVKCGY